MPSKQIELIIITPNFNLGYQGYTCGVKLPTSCDSKPCGKHGECHLATSISEYECKCHTGFIGWLS
jgi:hypothetical protein